MKSIELAEAIRDYINNNYDSILLEDILEFISKIMNKEREDQRLHFYTKEEVATENEILRRKVESLMDQVKILKRKLSIAQGENINDSKSANYTDPDVGRESGWSV